MNNDFIMIGGVRIDIKSENNIIETLQLEL